MHCFVCALFDCLLCKCLVHCFVCVLFTVCYVIVPCTVWYVFCCSIFCYVSVSCIVLNVFCWIVSHVSASGSVLYVFSLKFVTLVCRTLFYACSVDCLLR